MDLIKFHEDAAITINNTSLFSEAEKQCLIAVSENMEKAHQNSQVFRTDTEARMSVLNDIKFPTPASKYYQSLREMNVHQDQLVYLLYDYEDKKQDLKIIEADILELQSTLVDDLLVYVRMKTEAKIKKLKIELQKTIFSLKQTKRTAEGRKLEILQWDKILKELEPLLIENNIPLDDPDAHQKISYFIRHIRQAQNMNPQADGIAEVNNLIGQIITNARIMKEAGLVDACLSAMSQQDRAFVEKEQILIMTGKKYS
jgi:hypothetical protein